jgi:DNA-binding CsgD family transcriptional regulator
MRTTLSTWLDDFTAAVTSDEEDLAAIGVLLDRVIPSDRVYFSDVDFGIGAAVLADTIDRTSPIRDIGILLTPTGAHPAVTSYVSDPLDRSPRRISDITTPREWLRSEAYDRLFRPERARFQLSIVTTLAAPVVGRGWVLTRSDRDFTDEEVSIATALLPALTVAERIRPWEFTASGVEPADVALTERERSVLRHVALGLSAHQVALQLGISPRTVQKHLEHAYRKLGCSDRLLASRRAAALHLI